MANISSGKLYGAAPDYKTIPGSNRMKSGKKGSKRKKKGK